jgi:membrane-associated phospholipid phosphatase
MINSYLAQLNLSVFHAINGLAGRSISLDRLMNQLESYSLKGLVMMAFFGMLWFLPGPDQSQRRKILLLQSFAIGLTVLAIRSISLFVPFMIRPMYASDSGFRPLLVRVAYNLEDWSSFPSDQAGMMFALATGFWFASKKAGCLFFVFSIVTMFARIYVGIHFPRDILVGAAVGTAASFILNVKSVREFITRPLLAVERGRPAFFYGCLFAVLYETGILFDNVRRIGKAVLHVLSGTYGT